MNVPPKINRERVARAWRHSNGEIWGIDGNCAFANDNTGGMVFSVCASLDCHRPMFERIAVDERQRDRFCADALDQCGNVLREAGAPPFRIEVAYLRMQR